MASYYAMALGVKRFKPPEEDENILRLPSKITLEILSRLPVKTIIHCSSVCKAWRALLSDPSFPRFHLAKSPISLMLCGAPFRYWLVEFETEFPKRKMSKFNAENLVQVVGQSFEVGSCNGLFCVTNFSLDKFYVWNPVKNECIILPVPKIKKKDNSILLSGFGFCPTTNVYKVIRLVRYSDTHMAGTDSRNKAMCEVCTLGSNAWRRIEDVPVPHDGVLICKMPLNGAIHWICSSKINDERFSLWVCAFRIKDEKWDSVPPPLPLLEVSRSGLTDQLLKLFISSSLQLGVLENCLVFLERSHDSLLNIWMMKDYGVQESWTKCWSIEHQGISQMRVAALLPLRLTKDGDLLMYDNFSHVLVFLNPQKRILQKQKIYGVPKGLRGIAHVASFISPAKVMKEEC